MIPVDDLRTDDPDVFDADPDRGLHEAADRIPVEHGAWIDQQDEIRGLRHRTIERPAHGTSGSEPSFVLQDASCSERAVQHLSNVRLRTVVHREHADTWIRLVREREEAVAQ